MNEELLKEMEQMRTKCSGFIKDVSTPIKKQHGDDIEKYLETFIKFPGALSVVSIFFTSSSLVKNINFAILGMILIVSSLLIALNIFRKQINNDKIFYSKIVEVEKPMTQFNKSFTLFSRDRQKQNEDQLIKDYNALEESYDSNSSKENEKDDTQRFNSLYLHMNLSFWLLTAGIGISFLSILIC